MMCRKCGKLMGENTMGTILPLCQCMWSEGWQNQPTFYIQNSSDCIAELEAERDGLNDYIEHLSMTHRLLGESLAAAQARIKILREALDLLVHESMFKDHPFASQNAMDALSQPDDSTALDELLAKQYAKGYADGQGE